MPGAFDPYHMWLGIPPEEQPPHHYRLLAIRAFEENPEVIQNAADQRMSHLRSFQAGQHGKLSQKLLNEVAAARLCLLHSGKKAGYDEELRQRMAESVAAMPKAPEEAILAPPVPPPLCSPPTPPESPRLPAAACRRQTRSARRCWRRFGKSPRSPPGLRSLAVASQRTRPFPTDSRQ